MAAAQRTPQSDSMHPRIRRLILPVALCFLLVSPAATAQDTTAARGEDMADVLDEQAKTVSQHINDVFTPMVEVMTEVLFWDPFDALGIYDMRVTDEHGEPVLDERGQPVTAPLRLVVIWLFAGALFFTVYLKFVGFRGTRHAVDILRGKFARPGSGGEVSSFQSVTTALSATVGMGNIAGVALAVGLGGPGATFWMIMAGLLGMAMKFAECTFAVKYRRINADGSVSGGPMYYLREGLEKRGLGWLGWLLAVMFAVLVMGGSVGGGNMLQANQAFEQLATFFPDMEHYGAVYGLVLAVLVGLVIIGGIRRIGEVTERIVPFMAGLYIVAAVVIIAMNIGNTWHAFLLILENAFAPDAVKGGIIGVMIYGIQRGNFSNEAGIGSAAIAHSASMNDEPVSEGIVSAIEPFVDTVVICTMTALVLIFTGYAEDTQGLVGVQLTSAAFGSVLSWFPYILLICVTLFAFSTLISWSYYGLKGWDFLVGGFGEKLFGSRRPTNVMFQLIFLAATVIGASSDILSVMDFSDMMILAMAFPNLLGLYIMAPELRRDMNDYFRRLRNGELEKRKN
jgi:AGCS family alanine or glycine:cation symporter